MRALDGFIPYPTPKVARIKDSRLGLLRYALLCLIFCYVLVYQILWRGNHLETQELSGVYQLHLEHPTRNHCDPINVECMQNFTTMSSLPYCLQNGERSNLKLPCKYFDAMDLSQVTDEGLLIPTRISKYLQRRGCKPSAANNWTCNGWMYDYLDNKGDLQTERGEAHPVSDIFVADVEHFTVTLDHSVQARGGTRYYSNDMAGYWMDCKHPNVPDTRCAARAIVCGDKDCTAAPGSVASRMQERSAKFRGDRRSLTLADAASTEGNRQVPSRGRSEDIAPHGAGARASATPQAAGDAEGDVTAAVQTWRRVSTRPGRPRPPAPPRSPEADIDKFGIVSTSYGDIFTIRKLLECANVSLDKRRHNNPSWIDGSYRSSGFVLVVRLQYSNVEPWLGTKVVPWQSAGPTIHYTYRVSKHASHDDFKLRKVFHNHTSHSRLNKEFAGIRILMEQSGTVAVWDNIQLILILTTTLALIAVANCITDGVALYCMPNSDDYSAIKFDRPRQKAADAVRDGDSPKPELEEADDIQRYSSITM